MRIKRKATNFPDVPGPKSPRAPVRAMHPLLAPGTPHLYRNRHGTYYFRVRIHGREYKRSLGTKDPAAASMLASRLNYRLGMTQHKDDSALIADILAKAEANKQRKFDVQLPNGMSLQNIQPHEAQGALDFVRGLGYSSQPTPDELEAARAREARRLAERAEIEAFLTPTPAPTPKLLEAVEPYLTLMGHEDENEQKTINEKRATYRRLADLIGDIEVGQIKKEHMAQFTAQLVAEKLSTVRMNKLLSFVRHFLEYAVDNITGVEFNAFEGGKVSSKKKTKERQKTTSYQLFTPEELAQMFEPSAYKRYCRRQQHYYWMPLLCLCSGARPDEIAALPLSAVKVADGVDVLDVEKSKNVQSIRKIPIHQAVLDAGFLDYVASLRERQETQLFPGLKDSTNGYIKNVSRRFNQEHLNRIGITSSRKRLYSFRTTFINQLTEKNWNPVLIMAVVGHIEQGELDLKLPHFTNYQGPKTLTVLRDVVNAFEPLVSFKRLSL